MFIPAPGTGWGSAIVFGGGRFGPGDSPAVGDGRGVAGEVIANVPAPMSMAVLSGTAPLAMFGRYAVCGLLSFPANAITIA